MSRRRRYDDSPVGALLDLLFEITKILPWWIDLLLAIISYFSLHYFALKYPLTGMQGWDIATGFAVNIFQYLLPIIFFFGAIASFWNSFRGKELLGDVESRGVTEALAKMSWQDFELLMGQWFKTQGYAVVQAGGAHADGGIDIELRKDGELYLVQCKHYRGWKVPVDTVRDLYGVMTSRGAAGGFVVTSGRFTAPAEEFASGRVISLIDGEKLSRILKQSDVSTSQSTASTVIISPKCPSRGSEMVRRTAHHGDNSGKDFWGCSKYPSCKGIISIR